MRRRRVSVLAAGAVALCGAGLLAVPGATAVWAVPAAGAAVRPASSWGRAIEVPGLAALDKVGGVIAGEMLTHCDGDGGELAAQS